jgi:hypothetical protein
MGWAEQAWDAFHDAIRLQDKVEHRDKRVVFQQAKIEALNIEVAQLQVAVGILLSHSGLQAPPKLPFTPPTPPPLPGSSS